MCGINNGRIADFDRAGSFKAQIPPAPAGGPGEIGEEDSMSEFCEIHVTCADKEEAGRLGRLLLDKWLAACAQVSGPVESVYRWKGEIETAREWLLTLKTRSCLFDEVSEVILANHSYEVPQITAVPLDAISPAYEEWLAGQIR